MNIHIVYPEHYFGSKKPELLPQSLESPSIGACGEDVGEEDMEVIEPEDFAARKPEAADLDQETQNNML